MLAASATAALARRDQYLDFNIYGYLPSLAAAIVFLVCFILLTIVHSYLVFKSKVWWYIIVAVGGLAEFIGWIGRLQSNLDIHSLNAFLLQQICLVLAPCFYSAALYGSLGMLIQLLGGQYSKLRPKYYMILFCLADLVAIVVQAVGGAMAAIALETDGDSDTGTHIMVGGIAFQLLSMIIFCVLGFDFFHRARKDAAFAGKADSGGRKINRFAAGIIWGSFWILVRCVYRVVELSQGWTGYLITHQPYFLCLDSIPMVFVMAAFIPCHPCFCLPGQKSFTNQSRVGDEEMREERKESGEVVA